MEATKLSCGVYLFRGYKIIKHSSDGLLPGHKWIWEVVDRNGDAVNHTPTLRQAEATIKKDEERKNARKEENK